MDFLQKRIRQQDLSRKEGESKDFQWVINYSNLNLLPPFGKMCLLNLHQLEFFTGDIKVIENIHCKQSSKIMLEPNTPTPFFNKNLFYENFINTIF